MAHAHLRSDPALLRHLARAVVLAVALACVALGAGSVRAARVKDLADVQGVRSNPLIGYGLVVGLQGTGDSAKSLFASRSLAGLLSKLGIVVRPDDLKVTNVAAVMVTGELPPFARTGEALDVTVSSIGDSKSLQGAVLLATPLLGVDGEVFALAQGAVSIGGFAGSSGTGDSVQQNHPTVGRIPRGALVERELTQVLANRLFVNLILHEKDFTTAARMADAVNRKIPDAAHAPDSGTVRVAIPPALRADPVPFLAQIEELEVLPGRSATVVLNERTGTVVIGAEVSIAAVAITHGNLSIRVGARTEVSQPAPFSKVGDTVVFQNSGIVIQEEGASLVLVQGVTIGELVRARNAIGATPRDLIAILQAVKAAGAMQAELKII